MYNMGFSLLSHLISFKGEKVFIQAMGPPINTNQEACFVLLPPLHKKKGYQPFQKTKKQGRKKEE
jgi:hypothetical protein